MPRRKPPTTARFYYGDDDRDDEESEKAPDNDLIVFQEPASIDPATMPAPKVELPVPARLRAMTYQYLNDGEFLSLRREVAMLRAQQSKLSAEEEEIEAGVLVSNLISLSEQIRKLLVSYHDLEMKKKHYVSMQRFMSIVPLLIASISRHVDDEETLRLIGEEWSHILSLLVED